jgi:hypothetical protein
MKLFSGLAVVAAGLLSAAVPALSSSHAAGFSPAGELSRPRVGHTAGLLAEGRVLVVGGDDGVGRPSSSVEAWDPATGRSSPAGSLVQARVDSTITFLPDGRVLVVGGTGPLFTPEGDLIPHPEPFAHVEVFDPATGRSSWSGGMAGARAAHAAVALPDGRVLVVGGVDESTGRAVPSAEIWDPASEGFAPAGTLAAVRHSPTATLLADGRVLVVGGWAWAGARGPMRSLASAEVWDPGTERFMPAGELAEARFWHTATLLADGRVLVVGGNVASGGGELASAEVWDPATERFAPAGTLAAGRLLHSATLLRDGRVLVVGGSPAGPQAPITLASAELWDPVTGRFSPGGALATPRRMHSATPLPDGRVVVLGGIGGEDEVGLASAEVWAEDGRARRGSDDPEEPGAAVDAASPPERRRSEEGQLPPTGTPAPSTSPGAPGERLCSEYRVLGMDEQPVTSGILSRMRDVIEVRLTVLGAEEPIVETWGPDRIRVGLHGDEEQLRHLIVATGLIEFIPVPPGLGTPVVHGQPPPPAMADVEPLFTGAGIAGARAGVDEFERPVVDLELAPEAARIFDEHAEAHFGEQFAIIVDGIVEVAPSINVMEFGGRVQIAGALTLEEAQRIVALLRSGPLPVALEEVTFGRCSGPADRSKT